MSGVNIAIKIGSDIFEGGIMTGSGALAALALNSPIGPAGGAVGGALGWIAGKPVQYILERVFNTNKNTASVVSRIAQLVVSFFAFAGCFMLSGPILGRPVTFGAACALAGTTIGIGIALSIPFGLIVYGIQRATAKA
jgi:hypothetical protein